jgi:hypothetical protein
LRLLSEALVLHGGVDSNELNVRGWPILFDLECSPPNYLDGFHVNQ